MGSISPPSDRFNRARDPGVKHGQRLLPHVLDAFAVEDPDHIAGLTAKYNLDLSISFVPLTVAQLANAVNFTSYWLQDVLGKDSKGVIAYVGAQDLRYWVMEIAAIKIGHPLLIPSPRNAVHNNESLIVTSKCTTLFYSGVGTPIEAHVNGLEAALPDLKLHAIPSLEDMTTAATPHFPYTKNYGEAKADEILILHTSGSTGNPKPIYVSHEYLNRTDVDVLIPPVEGRTLASYAGFVGPIYNGSPFFHLSGVTMVLISIFLGTAIIIPPPDRLATPKVAMDIASSIELKTIVAAPSVVDAMFAENGDQLKKHFGGLKHITWFGGPLAESTGSWITRNLPSIHLWTIYGSTETNGTHMLVPPKSHWRYMEFHPSLAPDMQPISPSNPLHELVIHRHPNPKYAWSTPIFTVFPEKEEWRSRDLFSRCTDPGFSHLWKFEGRLDDILILNNAYKVNPLHIEVPLLSQPLLSGVLVFGAGYVRCGIVLEPRGGAVLQGKEMEMFVEKVWVDIQKANDEVPEHARVHRDLVIVADSERPFVRAGKGTVVRGMTTKLYAKEIADVYAKSQY